MEKDNPIINGVIWKQLLLFFFPIMFGTLFQQIYNVADTIIVGKFVGKEALAAVGGSVNQLINLLVGFFVGVSSGASVIVAQFYGANDRKNLSKSIHTAIAFSLTTGLIVGGICILGSTTFLHLLQTPEEIMADSANYLQIYFAGMVFNMLYNMGASILRACGNSKRPLYVLIASSLTNVFLDILLVAGFGLGVKGVACATILSQGLSAVLVMYMLLKADDIYRVTIPQIRFSRRSLLYILRMGIPAGLESAMYNVCNVVLQIFINKLGTNTIAAWGTLGKIDAFFWMIINAFAISITTFVGQNYGAGRKDRMKKSIRICFSLATASSIVLITFEMIFCKYIYQIFTNDVDVITLGIQMTRFLMPCYLLYIVIGILSGALRGAGRVLVPMLLTCVGVCSIRLVWLLGFVSHHPSIKMILLSYPISWSITAVFFIFYYFKKFPAYDKHGIQV